MLADTPVKYVKGVGDKRAAVLAKFGVRDVADLLRFYPRRYIDLTSPLSFGEAAALDEPGAVPARVIGDVEERHVREGLTLYRATLDDGADTATLAIFNSAYTAGSLRRGAVYIFYGKVKASRFGYEMTSPEIYPATAKGLIPVYPAARGLSSTVTRGIIKNALSDYTPEEYLPEELISKYRLARLADALRLIHSPGSEGQLKSARRRLVFDELFLFQAALRLKGEASEKTTDITVERDFSAEFAAGLPFTLTGAQSRVIAECVGEMMSGKRVNRLIEGDVGCGKTAVCASLIYTTVKNGHQAALMAPTEILAGQHYGTFRRFFEGTGVTVELLTGSVRKRRALLSRVAAGECDLLIGTHAVLGEGVEFRDLGLVITDEQHRFGVEQRSALVGKGRDPHTLVLSATPIPRTLAMILYGDLDISVIDELPAGRIPVATCVVDESYRNSVYALIKREVAAGHGAYIVCPLVEEGEEGVRSAEEHYKELSTGVFRDCGVGLLHGQMKPREKDAAMKKFASGETRILVATTVIEIGVDVPDATVMVVENAERFGLATLHQLRGRVGRGSDKSYCVLVSDSRSPGTLQRLNILHETTDGFRVADEDLRLRGPGDFLGTRQHGAPVFRLANLYSDMPVLRVAAEEARYLCETDPGLRSHPALRAAVDGFARSLAAG